MLSVDAIADEILAREGGYVNDPDDPGATDSLDWMRLAGLLIQRATQHSERAAGEVRSVALSFDDIGEELTNNRIDSEERKSRLANGHMPMVRRPDNDRIDVLFFV